MRSVSTRGRALGAAALGAGLALALAACSDADDGNKDAGPAPADQAATADGPAVDRGGGGDRGGGADQGGGADAGDTFHLSCQTVQFCKGCCPNEDQPCWDACEATLTAESKQAWAELQACGSTACADCSSDADCTACVEANCKTQRDACDFDATGAGTCPQMYACFRACPQLTMDRSGTAQTCPADPGLVCMQKCFHGASPAAADAVYALGYCQYMSCGEVCFSAGKEAECDSCLADKCAEPKQACDGA